MPRGKKRPRCCWVKADKTQCGALTDKNDVGDYKSLCPDHIAAKKQQTRDAIASLRERLFIRYLPDTDLEYMLDEDYSDQEIVTQEKDCAKACEAYIARRGS